MLPLLEQRRATNIAMVIVGRAINIKCVIKKRSNELLPKMKQISFRRQLYIEQ